MKKSILLISFFMLFSVMANGAEIIYVQSKKAKIMALPSFGSDSVGMAAHGDKLTVIEKNGEGWFKVKTEQTSGWINRLNVSVNPPLNKVSVINNNESSTLENKSRVRASAITSAAAARGLTEEERKRASSTEKADYKSLEKLESSTKDISDKEVEEFNEKK